MHRQALLKMTEINFLLLFHIITASVKRMMFFLDENITTFLAIARFDQNIWCNCDDASQGQEIL